MLVPYFYFVVFFTYQSHLNLKIHKCRQALNNHIARITVSRFLESERLTCLWIDLTIFTKKVLSYVFDRDLNKRLVKMV